MPTPEAGGKKKIHVDSTGTEGSSPSLFDVAELCGEVCIHIIAVVYMMLVGFFFTAGRNRLT